MQYFINELLTLAFVLVAFITAVLGICDPPTAAELVDITNLKQISAVKTLYSIDETVAYGCNDGYGNGYLSLTCKTNATWSERSRECNQSQPFGYGSLAGVLCGITTFIICVVFIIMSTKLKKDRQKEEELEMKIMDAAGATKA